jgi:hypothetical protein
LEQKAFTRKRLTDLVEKIGGPRVSIFMPTHVRGAEIEQDPIRLKNLLREAAEKLQGRFPQGPDPQEVLAPAAALVGDREFWRHQDEGLAIFASETDFEIEQLPLKFQERVVVGERYHVRPLLPLLTSDGEFFLLAISLDDSRLYQGAGSGLSQIDLPEGTPNSLAEALKFDDPEKSLQFHTGTHRAAGDRSAIFYGQGANKADERANIRRFFQQLSAGVEQALGAEPAPLLLAGVEYLLPMYRQVNDFPHLVEGQITGNQQEIRTRMDRLHQQAMEILQPEFDRQRQQALQRLMDQIDTKLTSAEIAGIVPAAAAGQIEILFVQAGAQQWGRYDASTHAAHLHEQRQESSVDLLDLAVQQTLEANGQVYLMPDEKMPIQAPAAALFRYTIEQEV